MLPSATTNMFRTKQAFFRDTHDMLFLDNPMKNQPKIQENVMKMK